MDEDDKLDYSVGEALQDLGVADLQLQIFHDDLRLFLEYYFIFY